MKRIAGLVGALALATTTLLAATAAHGQAPEGAIYRVPVRGVIELGLAPYVERSIAEAEKAGARAIVLDIETPGGRVDAAQRIVRALQTTKVPTYAFINIHAFSAGALIALATDGIYMRPGSVVGAATPVDGSGQKAPEKIVSAMRSEMRALAQARGLDPRIAEGMVDEAIEIPGVKPKGQLLTLTETEAISLGYAVRANDWNAVVSAISPSARVVDAKVNWAESLVRFFTHPVVAPMLLSLGFLGLIIELKTPAFGLAGLAGALSLGLFFGSHYLVGLAGWEELILLTAGITMVGIEMFVIPGFGLFGVGGALAILSSVYLSLVGTLATQADYSTAASILSTAILIVLVGAWVIVRRLPRSGRFTKSGLLLGEATDRESGYISADVRHELVGATGIAATDLRPAGVVQIGDERVDVVAESGWISAGTAVRVVRSEGYRHVVKPAS